MSSLGKNQLAQDVETFIADNNEGLISEEDVRQRLLDIIASMFNLEDNELTDINGYSTLLSQVNALEYQALPNGEDIGLQEKGKWLIISPIQAPEDMGPNTAWYFNVYDTVLDPATGEYSFIIEAFTIGKKYIGIIDDNTKNVTWINLAQTSVSNYLQLEDTPNSRVGKEGQLPVVNSGESAEEYSGNSLYWDISSERLALGNPASTSARCTIKGFSNASSTKSLQLFNSDDDAILTAYDSGEVKIDNIDTDSIYSNNGRPAIKMGQSNTFSNSVGGIIFGTENDINLSSGSFLGYALGNYLEFSGGGQGFNAWYLGNGVDSANKASMANKQIRFGIQTDVPTMSIHEGRGVNTTGAVSIGCKGINNTTASLTLVGCESYTEVDLLRNPNDGTTLTVRRPDDLAAGTFNNRVTIGTVIEVSDAKATVLGYEYSKIHVDNIIGNTSSQPFTVYRPIQVFEKSDRTFAAGINHEGNFIIGNSPISESSALIQMGSTTQGFLPPRMTTTERDAITNPAEGLVIYNLTTKMLNVYNGSAWV